MMNGKTYVKMTGITKTFGSVTANKNVNFKVIQICLLIVMIILLLIFCFMNLKHKKNENIDGTSKLWDIYDLNLTEMKYNLDKIAQGLNQ